MTVRLMYFAGLREAVGQSSEVLELPADISSLGQLRAYLAARGGVWADHFSPSRNLRAAVNQDMASAEAVVSSGDEVAFFPPVTGG